MISGVKKYLELKEWEIYVWHGYIGVGFVLLADKSLGMLYLPVRILCMKSYRMQFLIYYVHA